MDEAAEIEARVRRLEGRIVAARAQARECVRELLEVNDNVAFLLAERLPSLGSGIVPAVHELLGEHDVPPDIRGMAAWAGFQVGDRQLSLHVLLDQISPHRVLAPTAARTLAEAGIREAAPRILETLRVHSRTAAWRMNEVALVVGYLHDLHRLGVRLPDDDFMRLQQMAPSEVRSMAKRLHSPPQPYGDAEGRPE